jgi:rhodanese-related sulfurtransferase
MKTTLTPSPVTEIPPADSGAARLHFSDAFRYETDCWDVHASLSGGSADFVLLDVRSPELYEEGHIDGALCVPHRKIVEGYMARWPADTVFVVYCAGPHCNGAHRAAVRLAGLNRPVKLMIGGVAGWRDEGFALVAGIAAKA